MYKIKPISKVRISMEPAFQLIYWSICWLAFFLCVILILEKQQPVFSFILVCMLLILIYFGLGSTVKVTKDVLSIRYFRGLKKTSYPLSLFTKLSFFNNRLIKLERTNSEKPLQFYANKKNKRAFLLCIQHYFPEIDVEQVVDITKSNVNLKE